MLSDPSEGRPARRADADVERERRSSPTTCCRWGTRRSGTTPIRTRRTTPSGSGSVKPVLRAARERLGDDDHRHAPSQSRRSVGRERVLDRPVVAHRSRRRARHPQVLRVAERARREARRSTSTTRYMFEHSLPGLPERAAAEGMTPLEFMRRYGAFEVAQEDRTGLREAASRRKNSKTSRSSRTDASYTRTAKPASPNVVPVTTPATTTPTAAARSACEVDGAILRGFPDARAASSSSAPRTLADWGWPEYACRATSRATSIPRSSRPDQMVLIPTFRLPTQIHTRSANAKWLDELAHTNPLWIHPIDAHRARQGAHRRTACASRPRPDTSSSKRG